APRTPDAGHRRRFVDAGRVSNPPELDRPSELPARRRRVRASSGLRDGAMSPRPRDVRPRLLRPPGSRPHCARPLPVRGDTPVHRREWPHWATVILLLFCSQGLLSQPLLSLSAFFEHHRNDYYRLLLEVSRKGAWSAWIEFFLAGVEEQSRDAIRRTK